MGKILKAECSCGYESLVTAGSGREQYGEIFEFPHSCSNCQETVSADLLQPQVICPLCTSTDLKIYGTQVRDDAKKKPWFQKLFARREDEPALTAASMYCYNLEKTFDIEDSGQFCPKCKNQTLHFSLHAMFD